MKVTAIGELNIKRFHEALARAITVNFEEKYPGLEVIPKGIKRKEPKPEKKEE